MKMPEQINHKLQERVNAKIDDILQEFNLSEDYRAPMLGFAQSLGKNAFLIEYPIKGLLKSNPDIEPQVFSEYLEIISRLTKLEGDIPARIFVSSLPDLFSQKKFEELDDLKIVIEMIVGLRNGKQEVSYNEELAFIFVKLFTVCKDSKKVIQVVNKVFRNNLSAIDIAYSVLSSELDPTLDSNPLQRLLFSYLVSGGLANAAAVESFLRSLEIINIYGGVHFFSNTTTRFQALIRNPNFKRAILLLEYPKKFKELDAHCFTPTNLFPSTNLKDGKIPQYLQTFLNNQEARNKGTVGKLLVQGIVKEWIASLNDSIVQEVAGMVSSILQINNSEIDNYSVEQMRNPVFLIALKVYLKFFQELVRGSNEVAQMLQNFLREMLRIGKVDAPKEMLEFLSNLPGNKQFLDKLPPRSREIWMSENRVECEVPHYNSETKGLDVKKITIRLETDRTNIFNMSNQFSNSCLRPDQKNAWGLFANVFDLNKNILWVEDEKGETIARVLVGINYDQARDKLTLAKYIPHGGKGMYDVQIEDYISKLCEKIGATRTRAHPVELNGLPYYADLNLF